MADAGIPDELVAEAQAELRRLAGAYLRAERAGHSLQPTELVHEAYVRLNAEKPRSFADKDHFVAIAARSMRQLLVEHARRKAAAKRGGDWHRTTLSLNLAGKETEVDVLALHEALERLDESGDIHARVVELRFFGGLTIAATALHLGVSATTVQDRWVEARAWLHRELAGATG